ncbi:MAG TPA: 6-carboxytetrahydropterin synthase [Polyangiaceae bacterium]|nr:6-carboxytetrahydropterin synthase [Polyangiaceae bacterium]
MADLLYITRQAEISASHRLFNPRLDAADNERIFRNCSWPSGHGHNYTLQVTVVGEPDPETGMVINLKDLRRVMEERVVDKCDHRHLNEDVDFLRGVVTTTENLCVAFWRELEGPIADLPGSARLWRIRIQETRDNSVEYFGPGRRFPG